MSFNINHLIETQREIHGILGPQKAEKALRMQQYAYLEYESSKRALIETETGKTRRAIVYGLAGAAVTTLLVQTEKPELTIGMIGLGGSISALVGSAAGEYINRAFGRIISRVTALKSRSSASS